MNPSVGEFSSARLARPLAVEHRMVREKAAAGLVALLGGYAVLTCLLQLAAGAYTAEFSGYPDEAAHFTTGLMLRDYIAHGLGGNPVRFAENYYLHYPKVAIGHWPPLFHLLEALWLLVFPVSRISVMGLMALYCATTATLLARWISPVYGNTAGWLTGALLIALPLVQQQTSMVMAEGLLAILAFLAAGNYASYLAGDGWRPGLRFALFSTLAIFAKGNGWALLLLPFFAVLFTRRYSLLRRADFWIPLGAIFVLCAPWQIMTARFVRQGWTGSPGPAYFVSAWGYFARELWFGLNPVILLIAIAGAGAALARRGGAAPQPASMAALFASFLVFHGLTPVGWEIRQLMPAIPALLTFVPAGSVVIAGFLRNRGMTLFGKPGAIAATAGLFFAGETFAVTPVQCYGFKQAARYLESRADSKDDVVLVSSEAEGEGIAVSESAMADVRPGHYILRANKVLARADWSGDQYEPLFSSAAAVRDELNLLPASVLVVDFTRGEQPREHHRQLLRMLASHPAEWRLAASFGPEGGDVRPVRIYVRDGPRPQSGEHFRSILAEEIHRIGEQ